MGYIQVDGNKEILVKETGECRHGLRNLPADSDRFEYQYDEGGNKANEWPYVVVAVDSDGVEDKRLLPELVMKIHGKLPDKIDCSPEDFESKSGSKSNPLDSNINNIEYVGDASVKGKSGSSPYKKPPEEEKKAETKDEPEDKKAEEPETPPAPEPEDSPPDEGEKQPGEKPEIPDDKPDLMKGSGALNAKEAIKIIRDFEYEELIDVGFYTEDDREDGVRVTVEEAWEAKKKSAEEGE